MKDFWETATHSKLYKDWLGGIVTGLLLKGGLYNSEPMEEFLADQYKDVDFPLKIGLDMGIVNIKDGKYIDFNEKNITMGSSL
jgi:hypothetical protein